MEVELGPFPKYENTRSNAYWSRVHIDTSFMPDIDDIEAYKEHIKDCYVHPTSGMLAHRKYITAKPMDYPGYAKRNKKFFDNQQEIKDLQKSFKARIKALYPKTMQIREFIINNDRIKFDYVEPSKGYCKLDKLKLILKKLIK